MTTRRRRSRPARAVIGTAALLALPCVALVTPQAGADVVATTSAPMSWSAVLDAYRSSSGLPPVAPDPSRQAGMDAHVRYLSITGLLSHGEQPGHPLFTADGSAAGAASVLGGWKGRTAADREHIEGWMRAPFHAVHLLEPRLRTTTFASVNGLPGAVLTSAAALDVIRGISPAVGWDRPILFPADGATVPLTRFETEHPDPLTACPGYLAPTGLPVLAMFPTPPGSASAVVTDDGGTVLPSCTVDAGYRNPVAADQALGRRLLTQKNAVFVVPREPLVPGRRYTVSFTTTGAGAAATTFTVAEEGGPLPAPAATPLVITPKRAARVAAAATTSTTVRPTTTVKRRTIAVRATTTRRRTR